MNQRLDISQISSESAIGFLDCELGVKGLSVIGNSRVFNMDCMDLLRQTPDEYFSLCIADPPYGIGMDGGNVGYKGFNNLTKKDWDSSIPEADYFKELFRVSKNQIIWGGKLLWTPSHQMLCCMG